MYQQCATCTARVHVYKGGRQLSARPRPLQSSRASCQSQCCMKMVWYTLGFTSFRLPLLLAVPLKWSSNEWPCGSLCGMPHVTCDVWVSGTLPGKAAACSYRLLRQDMPRPAAALAIRANHGQSHPIGGMCRGWIWLGRRSVCAVCRLLQFSKRNAYPGSFPTPLLVALLHPDLHCRSA